jgi:uncharacterized transporter YbjL
MEVRFEKDFNIQLSDNTIEQYDMLLSRFKDWLKYKRDIKINSLLESGKRIEFTVELQDNTIYISSVVDDDISKVNSLNNACAVVKNMKFIIYENKVEKLDIKISTLTTYYGKIIHDLIRTDIDVKLNQYIDSESGNIIGFYINDRLNRAA